VTCRLRMWPSSLPLSPWIEDGSRHRWKRSSASLVKVQVVFVEASFLPDLIRRILGGSWRVPHGGGLVVRSCSRLV